MKNPTIYLSLGSLLGSQCLSFALSEQDLQTLEQYSLAADKQKVLQKLVPGSEISLYLQALQAEQNNDSAKLRGLLGEMRKRYGNTELYQTMMLRHIVKVFPALNAEEKNFLNALTGNEENPVNMQPDEPDAAADAAEGEEAQAENGTAAATPKKALPSSLDKAHYNDLQALCKKLIAEKTFAELSPEIQAYAINNNLINYKDAQFDFGALKVGWLDSPQWLELLSHFINSADLGRAQGYIGNLGIEQIKQLATLNAKFANSQGYVQAVLDASKPDNFEIWSTRPDLQREWMKQQWPWLKQQAAKFNSLKAAFLGELLNLNLKAGIYDKQLFLEFLQLPRRAAWYNQQRLQNIDQQSVVQEAYQAQMQMQTNLPPANYAAKNNAGGNVPVEVDLLTLKHLDHFLLEAPDTREFMEFINLDYLQRRWATVNLLRGKGNVAQWQKILGNEVLQQLNQQINIDFADSNPDFHARAEVPKLNLQLKNVPELIVRIYDLNTLELSRRGISDYQGLSLEGMRPNFEQKIKFEQPALLLHDYELKLEHIGTQSGSWVVELIGNGRASRVVINKGKLSALRSFSDKGILVNIIDEQAKPVPNAKIYTLGNQYVCNEKGQVLLPYSSTQNALARNIATSGICAYDPKNNFANMIDLQMEQIRRELKLDAFMPDGAIQSGNKLNIRVRPQLLVNNTFAKLAPQNELQLEFNFICNDGATSVQQRSIKPEDIGKLSSFEFDIPQGLQAVDIRASLRMEKYAKPDQQELLQSSLQLECGKTNQTLGLAPAGLYLRSLSGLGWVLEVRNRNGEPQANVDLKIRLSGKLGNSSSETLRSDAKGRVVLGKLAGIEQINVKNLNNKSQNYSANWSLGESQQSAEARQIFLDKNQATTLAHTPASALQSFALFKISNGVRSKVNGFSQKNGEFGIPALEAGQYVIQASPQAQVIKHITVGSQSAIEGWKQCLDPNKLYKIERPQAQIGERKISSDEVKIRIVGAAKDSKLIVHAHQFRQNESFAGNGHFTPEQALSQLEQNPAIYLSGKVLAEEFRYILERGNYTPYNGVLLAKPGMTLNPWQSAFSNTVEQQAKAGNDFSRQTRNGIATKAARPGSYPPVQSGESAGMGGALADRDDSGAGGGGFAGRLNKANRAGEPFAGKHGMPFYGLNALGNGANLFSSKAPQSFVLTPDKDGWVSLKRAQIPEASYLAVYLSGAEGNAEQCNIVLEVDEKLEPACKDLRQTAIAMDAGSGVVRDVKIIDKAPQDGKHDRQLVIADANQLFSALSSACQGGEAVVPLELPVAKLCELPAWKFLLEWTKLDKQQKIALYHQHASHELNLFIWQQDPQFLQEFLRPLLANKSSKELLDALILGQNVDSWLELQNYAKLNLLEKALLSRQLPADHPRKQAIVGELQQLAKANQREGEEMTRRFDSVLGFSQQEGQREQFSPPEFPSAPSAAADSLEGQSAVRGKKDMEMALELDAQPAYQSPEKTMQMSESRWFALTRQATHADLFRPSQLWSDLASAQSAEKFLSKHFLDLADDWRSSLVALALLQPSSEGKKLCVSQEAVQLKKAAASQALGIMRQFYRLEENMENASVVELDKLEAGVTYVMRTIISNPSGTQHQLTMNIPIPQGAVGVWERTQETLHDDSILPTGNNVTRTINVDPLSFAGFHTLISFPKSGEFSSNSATLSDNTTLYAASSNEKLKVSPFGSFKNLQSWDWIARYGSAQEVLEYLKKADCSTTALENISWRLQDKKFYEQLMPLLQQRMWFDETVYSFSIRHGDRQNFLGWLKYQKGLVDQLGPMQLQNIKFRPEVDGSFEVFDYVPYVNARCLRLGEKQEILNDKFKQQYAAFISNFARNNQPSADDLCVLACYLLLQERIEETLQIFAKIDREKLSAKIQYDYLHAWLSLAKGEVEVAENIVKQPRTLNRHWQQLYGQLTTQLEEIRTQKLSPQSGFVRGDSLESFLAVSAVENKLQVRWRGLQKAKVQWYPVDIEFLFSQAPFLAESGNAFSLIKPSVEQEIELKGNGVSELDVPEKLRAQNLIVEISSGEKTGSTSYFANNMDLSIASESGQLMVRGKQQQKPLNKAYVKVFCRDHQGKVSFYKDGYTDLRGCFDYASLSTDKLDTVARFSILVMHPQAGAVVRECPPPAR